MQVKELKAKVRLISVTVMLTVLFILVPAEGARVKNVILLIGDGMGVSTMSLARWYKDGQPLSWDQYVCGLVRTYSADEAITDSAAAATAMATGHKTKTGFLSVLPDEMNRAPVATVLEGARLSGKSTGLVVTCNLQHATPAAFAAHYPRRSDFEAICEQMVYNQVDVLMGGGLKYFTGRKDREDLLQVLKQKGYTIITSPDGLKSVSSSRLAGLFAEVDLAYDLDRDPTREPSLAEMTETAIKALARNKNGFFLMVEGSKIDWANHDHDPVASVRDMMAFDRAVRVALDYALKEKNTVVIVVADHSTGGLTIGNDRSSSKSDGKKVGDFVNPLKAASLSAEGLEKLLRPDMTEVEVKTIVNDRYGLADLTEEELKTIMDYLSRAATDPKQSGKLKSIVGPMISKRAMIDWTTGGHTGEEVALAVYHPEKLRPEGVIENIDIARYVAGLMQINLEAITREYFIEAEAAFKARGAQVELDTVTDPDNPVLKVKKGNQSLAIPANKDFVEMNGSRIQTRLINVYNRKNFYVSRQVISLLSD
ncbi:MAG TPA: alkaline phosphatase [Candidatus Saccharicenans sp.]|nr:alkaline phosphatase [Candidatus Saccharicenans sp.]HQM75556.1 alkaline phosphatase [Candidatus Saccharicenans sp.]